MSTGPRSTARPIPPVPPEHERLTYIDGVRAQHTAYDLMHIGGLPMWCATGHRDAKRLLTDPRVVNCPSPVAGHEDEVDLFALGPTLTGGHVLRTDGPAHARLRAAITPAFSRQAVTPRRPFITHTTNQLLDDLPRTEDIDLVEAFARPLVSRLLGHVIGLTAARSHEHAVLQRHNSEATDTASQRRTAFALTTLLLRVLTGADGDIPDGSLMASMLRPPRDITPLSLPEAVENLIAVYRAGLAPTISALAYGAARIAEHRDPQVMAALHDPGRTDTLVEELLRLHPPHAVTTPRVTTGTIETTDAPIPAGATVTACLATANRDPDHYPAPDALRLDRDRPTGHLAFGWGPHICAGAPLVRQLLRLALPALFQRHPRLRLTVPFEELRFHGSYSDRMPIAVPVSLGVPIGHEAERNQYR